MCPVFIKADIKSNHNMVKYVSLMNDGTNVFSYFRDIKQLTNCDFCGSTIQIEVVVHRSYICLFQNN